MAVVGRRCVWGRWASGEAVAKSKPVTARNKAVCSSVGSEARNMVLVIGVVGTSSTLLSMVVVDKLGRRALLLMFPLEIRPAGQAIVVAVSFLFTAVVFFFFEAWVAVTERDLRSVGDVRRHPPASHREVATGGQEALLEALSLSLRWF